METCEKCVKAGGGWCLSMERCVEDDTEACPFEDLIGLSGETNDCPKDEEKTSKEDEKRKLWAAGDLVAYDGGAVGVIHRAYYRIAEYTVRNESSGRLGIWSL